MIRKLAEIANKSIWRVIPPFLFIFFCASIFSLAQEKVAFRVCDDGNNPLPYANIRFQNNSNGTITNAKGYFQVPSIANQTIIISHLGYQTLTLNPDTIVSGIITLKEQAVGLSEINIKPGDGLNIVRKALKNIPQNYSCNKQRQRAFYREYLYENEQLKTVTESSLSVTKMPYNEISNDEIYIEHGKSFVHDSSDIEIVNGPQAIFKQCDIVKNKSYILEEKNIKKHNFMISSILQNEDRTLYEIRFFPKNKKNTIGGDKFSGEIYIDTTNFSIIKADIEKLAKTGKKSGNKLTVNYQLFGEQLTLSNAQKQVSRNNDKAIAELAITNFDCNTCENTQVKIEKGIPLNQYLSSMNYSDQTIMPDTIAKRYLLNKNRPAYYKPTIELFYGTDFSTQLDLLSRNFNSLSHISNYILSNSIKNGMVWSFAQVFMQFAFINPLSMSIAESAMLRKNDITHKIVPFIFNEGLSSYCKANNVNNLQSLYKENLFDFIRLGTVRNELLTNQIDNMEDYLFENDFTTISFSNIFFIDLFIKRSSLFFNHFMVDQEYIDTGNHTNRNLRTIYFLSNQTPQYKEIVTLNDLTKENRQMVSRAKWFSLLNLVSPYIIGKQNIELGKNLKANFSLGYMLTPVGEAYIQNYWVKVSQDIYKLNITLYRRGNKTGYNFEFDFLNKKVAERVDLQTKLFACNTSTYLPAFGIPNTIGLGFEQEIRYTVSSKCNLNLGFTIKSPGYFFKTLSTKEDIQLRTGISWKL